MTNSNIVDIPFPPYAFLPIGGFVWTWNYAPSLQRNLLQPSLLLGRVDVSFQLDGADMTKILACTSPYRQTKYLLTEGPLRGACKVHDMRDIDTYPSQRRLLLEYRFEDISGLGQVEWKKINSVVICEERDT